MKNSPTGPLYRGGLFLRCMVHGLAGCYLCSPPANNSNPSGGSEGADGRGVCTLTAFKLPLVRNASARIRALAAARDREVLAARGPDALDAYWAVDALECAVDKNVALCREFGLLLHVGFVS